MIKYAVLVFVVLVVAIAVVVALQRATIGGTKRATMINTSQKTVSLTSGDTSAFISYLADKKPIVLDVRTPEEYAEGHISGAQNMDFYARDFSASLEKLDRNTTYAIYCRSGNRSGQALEIMRSLGFVSVLNLSGGILAWEDNGGDVCTSASC